MLARCYSCYEPLAENTTLEHFPVGRRVAFDPVRGRLWAVCPVCRRWSLAPIEERWEALEELERVARDRGRVRVTTENISLLRAGDVEIVRVGREARLREESYWRYGREFAARQRRAQRIEGTGEAIDIILTGAAVVAGLLFLLPIPTPKLESDKWLRWARRRRFGRRAWAGDAACEVCGQPLPPALFEDRPALVLEPSGEVFPRLRRRCHACGADSRSGVLLDGPSSRHVLRRLLAYENYVGATAQTVGDAVDVLEDAGSPPRFLAQATGRHLVLGRIPPRVSFALEIALSDAHEEELLQLEVAALELRWREEEALAAIVDGELTPLPPGAARRGAGSSSRPT